jgi:predicted AlkP superfamily pyrophosphatase or phosphodiesterase
MRDALASRRSRSLLVKSFLLLAAFVVSIVVVPAVQAAPANDRIVVLISIDGLANFYFDDPKAEMPTIREMAAKGARADGMKAVLPTVTWPNHTTLVTGVRPAKHGVLSNSYFDRETNKVVVLLWDPLLDKEEIVKVPTIYDLAKQAKMKTAAVCWPGSRGAKTLDWTVPAVDSNELFYAYGTPSLWKEFDAAGIPHSGEAEGFLPGRGEERDSVHVDMFNEIVRLHRPQLALLHLLELDHIQHVKGPQSPEAYRAIKFVDDCILRVRETLDAEFKGRATVLLVSDHGFLPFQQVVQPNVLLQKEGLLEAEGKVIKSARVRAVGSGGSTFLYILDQLNRDELIKKARTLFEGAEGFASFIAEKDFAKYGMADPKRNPQMADVVLTAAEGYSLSDAVNGDLVYLPKSENIRGTHGYDPNLPQLKATFVAWGAGIKSGARLGPIANIDVAPTIAALLGIKMKGVEGDSLRLALRPKK